MGHKQHESCVAYFAGECVDDGADVAEVDVGGSSSVGSVHMREIDEDNSEDDPST